MDTIMDKISQKLSEADANTAPGENPVQAAVAPEVQKLTANDMIRANSMADAQEKERLKAEVAEYKACLEHLKEIADTDSRVAEAIDALNKKLDDISGDESEIAIKEALHKEGVRVYKNVQAIVTEETAKSKDEVLFRVNALNGRISGVLAVAIVTLGINIATVAFLALSYLGIF